MKKQINLNELYFVPGVLRETKQGEYKYMNLLNRALNQFGVNQSGLTTSINEYKGSNLSEKLQNAINDISDGYTNCY
jgi:hypothetical protein